MHNQVTDTVLMTCSTEGSVKKFIPLNFVFPSEVKKTLRN